MSGAFLLLLLRNAALSSLSIGVRNAVSAIAKRLYAALQALLAKYPALVPSAAVVVASFLARFGFNVSATTLVVIASAVAVFIGGLAHQSAKAAARKPAK